MGNDTAGMGAEVSVQKLPDGEQPDEKPPRWAYIIVFFLCVFASLGLWRAVELVLRLL